MTKPFVESGSNDSDEPLTYEQLQDQYANSSIRLRVGARLKVLTGFALAWTGATLLVTGADSEERVMSAVSFSGAIILFGASVLTLAGSMHDSRIGAAIEGALTADALAAARESEQHKESQGQEPRLQND